jgi:hypothetical protein
MAERHRLPGFVRRRPFPWAVAGAFVAGSLASELLFDWRLGSDSDASTAISFPLEALAFLLPAFMIVRWRGIGGRARALGLAACVLWWMSESHSIRMSARDLRSFALNIHVVDGMLREPRRAMRRDPREAVAAALAAGDSSFLAVGGSCGSVPGVDSAVAHRQGLRVITGTYHDGPPLTPGHRRFEWDAHSYAWNYNDALAERLGIEAIPPGAAPSNCFDPTPMRGRAPLFWP